MLVPLVLADKRSPVAWPNGVKVPFEMWAPVIETVALARSRSSTSVIDTAVASVVAGPSSVYEALAATLLNTGGSLVPTTVTVEVCAALFSRPSFTVQLNVREVSDP